MVALPVAEIWALIRVGGSIGVLNTILILFALSFAGIWTLRLRLSGFAQATVADVVEKQRVIPTQVADHALRILGALLLFIPGFVTGAMGIALFVKPLRVVLARSLGSKLHGVVDPLIRQRSRFGSGVIIDVDTVESDTVESDGTNPKNRPNPKKRPAAELPHSAPEV